MLLKYSFAFLKHGSVWTYRLATWAVLILGFGFAAAVIALRYLFLPNIDAYREPIVTTVSRAVGQPVSIGRIEGSWRGYRPELRLFDVRLLEPGGEVGLELARVDTVLSWVSLLAGDVVFHSLEISGPVLEMRRDSLGVIWVAGNALEQGPAAGGGFADWLIAQRQIIVRNARIVWIDEMQAASELIIDKVNLRIDNDGETHRIGLIGTPPPELASALVLRGEFTGRSVRALGAWRGRVYAEVDYANLAQAQTWVPVPNRVESGLGVLRLWLDVAELKVGSAIADLDLVNVRARPFSDEEPLELAHVSGRMQWRDEGSATLVSASGLTLEMVGGAQFPPLSFSLRRDSAPGHHSELTLAALELAPLSQFIELLPLDPDLKSKIALAQPAGRVLTARVVWSQEAGAAGPYSVQAEFENLEARPVDSFPGFRRFSGKLDATEVGGTVSLRAQRASLELPKVFPAPIPLDFLTGEAGWQYVAGHFVLTIRSASFTNDHLAGGLSGTYMSAETGPGNADFTASLVRGEAKDVWRYVPNTAPNTREWLKRALLSGRATDVRARLRGPLEKFPFADRNSGDFEVLVNAQDIVLDYADGWPPVEGFAGEIAFRRNRMDITPKVARLLEMDVSRTLVSIPAIGHREEHLLIKGEVAATVPQFLRFASVSPVASHIGQFTGNMSGVGQAQLNLELDLPLHDVDAVKVSGRLALSGARMEVSPRVPPLSNYSARIDFTQNSVSVKNGAAQLLGGAMHFDVANRKDRSLAIGLRGRANVSELTTFTGNRVLGHLYGSTDWRGALSLRKDVAQLRIESDLVGIGSRLPAPLYKSPQTSLPSKLDIYDRPDQQQLISLALGAIGSAQVLFEGGVARRGMLNFGGQATLPSSEVVAAVGSVAALDVDAWRLALRDTSASPDRTAPVQLSSVNLQVAALDVTGRRFADLRINGVRLADAWRLKLDGRQGKGEATWKSGDGGRLTARFSSLAIPAPASEVVASDYQRNVANLRDSLPAFDILAENFTFEGMNLGRLELNAAPEANSWRLDRLAITNPDGRAEIGGRWAVTDFPRTELQVRIDASNIGGLFSRFGFPEGIKGGRGTLTGPVTWVGSPYRPDLPTLSGRLKLEAKDGRFDQLEPGVAKLLGILSLQSLPRRVTFDFRDLFSAGFSFDTITADVTVSSGVAHTEDLRMVGSSARVRMKGRINLAEESQDLHVRVFPQLSTAAAVAGAVVNPAIGVATLIVQKALGDPFESMAAVEYRVTGSWADPIVERVSRKSDSAEARK